ncbi:MAG: hypothetical protein U9O20_00940 [Patescibacteria group bacterium]|nr:hypothetical protein [Patescibacteria group bacterium]
MRISIVHTLNAIARVYINVRIFLAIFLLLIPVFGLWHVEKEFKNHLYCKDG